MTGRKVLILGNSHVAAIRRGWTQIAGEFQSWHLEFFAGNSKLFNKMTLDENKVFGAHGTTRLSPRQQTWLTGMLGVRNVNRLERRLPLDQDEGSAGYSAHQLKFLDQVFGRRTVDLRAFEIVILVGRNVNEVDFLRQFEPYSIDGLCEEAGKPSLSYSTFSRFCREIAMKRLPEPMWHGWDKPRVAILPPPIPCSDCPEDDPRYDIWARYGRDPLKGLPFLKTYRAHVEALYREYGLTLLTPPDEVYDDTGLTRPEFGEAPTRLHPRAGTFDESDFHHMGADYGAIVLRHVLRQLQAKYP